MTAKHERGAMKPKKKYPRLGAKPPLDVVRAIRADYKPGLVGWGVDSVAKIHGVKEWIVKDIVTFKTLWSRTVDPELTLAQSEPEEQTMDRIEGYLRTVPCAKAHEITRATGIRRVECDRMIALLLMDERIHDVITILQCGSFSPTPAYAAGPKDDADVIFDKHAIVKQPFIKDWPRGQHGRDPMALPPEFFGEVRP